MGQRMCWLFWMQASQLSLVTGIFLLTLWDDPPPIISQHEVYDLADALISRYGAQAEEMTFLMEEIARRKRDSYEREKWRQVRERIEVVRRDASPAP
jgi:hypothetical protein